MLSDVGVRGWDRDDGDVRRAGIHLGRAGREDPVKCVDVERWCI